MRLGARGQPARHQLAPRHRRVRHAAAASRWPSTRDATSHARHPRRRRTSRPRSGSTSLIEGDGPGVHRRRSGHELQEEMMDKASVVTDRGVAAATPSNMIDDLRAALRQSAGQGPQQDLQHRAGRAHRARLPARHGRGARRLGPGPDREPRRPLPRGPHDARGRPLAEAHVHHAEAGRRRPSWPTKTSTMGRYVPVERKY